MVVIAFLFFFPNERMDHDIAELTAVSSPEDSENKEDLHESKVMVDVKGEVNKPGVYEVESDARVNEVIKLAGGFSEEADETPVNLAQKVQDEMVIMVPKAGEFAVNQEGHFSEQKVRINAATKEEIETLPGIGSSKAQAIIQYREEYGFFKTPEDLLEVSGIGEKTLEIMRDGLQIP